MKYYILLSFIACSLLCGCGSDGPRESGSVQELLPLKVGNKWLYVERHFNPAGVLVDFQTNEYEITSSRPYLGHDVFQFSFNGDTSKAQLMYYNGTNEVSSFATGDDSSAKVILHSPATEGQSIILNNPAIPSTWTLKEATAFVTIESGVFRCSHFEDSSDKVSHLWYCKKVGLVKQEDYEWLNGNRFLSFSSEISSFTIN